MNQIWLYPSLGNAFISLEISSQFFIFFSLFSFILAWTFISLQIKEFRIMSLSINDSVYSCLFFFLTGLHFFHLSFGLFLSCLLFWSCSFPFHFFSPAGSSLHLVNHGIVCKVRTQDPENFHEEVKSLATAR